MPYKNYGEWLINELSEEAKYMETEGYSTTASKFRDALTLLKEQNKRIERLSEIARADGVDPEALT